MTTYRMTGAIAGAALLFTAFTIPASAQLRPGLADFNKASESELAQLPGMTPAIAKGVVEHRPFKSPIDLSKFLADQKLTADQVKALYGKAFVPINLNTGTKEEFTLIPGVGARMSAEFAEYRPWKTVAQFDKEIGKYVNSISATCIPNVQCTETERLKQYVFIPAN